MRSLRRKIISVAAVAAIILSSLSITPAQAASGPCGLYGSGYAINTYCGDGYGGVPGINKIAATKATMFYSAGKGGISLRYGTWVSKPNTSYISANAGDTGDFGCDRKFYFSWLPDYPEHINCG